MFVEVERQRRHRRKLSFTMKKYPRAYRPGSAESFPVRANFAFVPLLIGLRERKWAYGIHFPSTLGVNIFIVAATGLPSEAAATAASCSNSSGVRYPNAECSRCRL